MALCMTMALTVTLTMALWSFRHFGHYPLRSSIPSMVSAKSRTPQQFQALQKLTAKTNKVIHRDSVSGCVNSTKKEQPGSFYEKCTQQIQFIHTLKNKQNQKLNNNNKHTNKQQLAFRNLSLLISWSASDRQSSSFVRWMPPLYPEKRNKQKKRKQQLTTTKLRQCVRVWGRRGEYCSAEELGVRRRALCDWKHFAASIAQCVS